MPAPPGQPPAGTEGEISTGLRACSTPLGPLVLEVEPRPAVKDNTCGLPAPISVKRIGQEGAFRRGLEPLWDEMFDWLADDETSDAAYMGASPTP